MLLLKCPERIRRIALIASGGLGKEISFLLRLASIPYVVEYLGQPFMEIVTKLICSLGDTGRTREEIRILCAMNGQKGSARVFARSVRDLMNLSGQRYTFYQRSHEISSLPPMRVFWGEEDSIIPMKHGKVFSRSIEGTRLVSFTDCGHSPHHQQPKLLAEALNEFLNTREDEKVVVIEPSLQEKNFNVMKSTQHSKTNSSLGSRSCGP
jgi:pimeloyl-ACP methyl ester carboxylesterase